jgi:hypothetical protein
VEMTELLKKALEAQQYLSELKGVSQTKGSSLKLSLKLMNCKKQKHPHISP